MADNALLIADDEESIRRLLYEVGSKAGYEVYTAADGEEAIKLAREINPAVIMLDIRMPAIDGLKAFEMIHAEKPDTVIILMTAYGTASTAAEAMARGAFDYLIKPSDVNQVRELIARAFTAYRLNKAASAEQAAEPMVDGIVGRSDLIQRVFLQVGRVAGTNSTVLITGESGSGKGVVAKAIHDYSPRRSYPFVKVSCGAIPEQLIESELFGYEKGAFTGAVVRKLGRFELANKGTIFLDEVAELTPMLQVKLLRVLQDREFERVGGTETIKVDVRIIAATNRDLEAMVKKGQFREDLYYRLNVFPIRVPSLRERKEDIPLFINYFLRRFSAEMNRKVPVITPEAWRLLNEYHWPGNVRELANILERAVIMSRGVITPAELSGLTVSRVSEDTNLITEGKTLKEILQEVERKVIAETLAKYHGNRVQTAKELDISRRALQYKIEQYGL